MFIQLIINLFDMVSRFFPQDFSAGLFFFISLGILIKQIQDINVQGRAAGGLLRGGSEMIGGLEGGGDVTRPTDE